MGISLATKKLDSKDVKKFEEILKSEPFNYAILYIDELNNITAFQFDKSDEKVRFNHAYTGSTNEELRIFLLNMMDKHNFKSISAISIENKSITGLELDYKNSVTESQTELNKRFEQ